jgi:hypothetical protein
MGLVLHEIAGHGGAAAAVGCRLTELRLFLFGGGYVGYECGALGLAQELAIDLGGIALELAAGAGLLWLARRRGGLPGLFAAATGLLFVLHALFYLATGVHYGAGDGRMLHGLLGANRAFLVLAASALLLGGSLVAGRQLGARLAAWVPARGWRARAATLAAAGLAAAAVHGGLMRAEQALLADPVYAGTFQPEHERQIAAQLERFERAPRTPTEVAVRRDALHRQHAVFPLTPVLGAGMALAALAGIGIASRRSGLGAGVAPPARVLGAAALACALSIALASTLDCLL